MFNDHDLPLNADTALGVSRPNAVFAVGLIAFALVVYAFVPMRFEVNDDTVMMMLASGAYSGEPSSYLVFINALLGACLSWLYQMAPSLPWYPGMMLLALSICVGLVLAMAAQNSALTTAGRSGLTIALVALLISLTVEVQFTTVAAMSVALGAWGVLTIRSSALVIVSAVLLIFGFLLRFDAGMLVVVVAAPFFVLGLSQKTTSINRNVSLCALITVAVALEVLGTSIYSGTDPDYWAFNALRGEINDNPHALLTADALPPGISLNDLTLFRSFFADQTVFDLEQLQALHAAVMANADSVTVRDWARALASILTKPVVLFTLGLAICMVLACTNGKHRMWLIAGCFAFVLPLLWVEMFATLKERVALSAIGAVLVAAFALHHTPSRSKAVRMGTQLMLAGLTLSFFLSSAIDLRLSVLGRPVFQDQARVIGDWDGPVYAFGNHLAIANARLFSDDLAPLEGNIEFAGWLVGHPENDEPLRHTDLLTDNAAVFLRQHPAAEEVIELLVTSLAENYGIQASAEVVVADGSSMLVQFHAERRP